jgi:hypothetical protein
MWVHGQAVGAGWWAGVLTSTAGDQTVFFLFLSKFVGSVRVSNCF